MLPRVCSPKARPVAALVLVLATVGLIWDWKGGCSSSESMPAIEGWEPTAPALPLEPERVSLAADSADAGSGEWPRKAFVTFVGKGDKYMKLMQVLIESIHEFSAYPLIVYQVQGVSVPVDKERFPRVVLRRLESSPHSLYFDKIQSVLASHLDVGVYVEADDVVNWSVDELFDVAERHARVYPLLPRHTRDPLNQDGVMREMGVAEKTMPYGHAHLLFTSSCMPFFLEVYQQAMLAQFNGANWDETGINVMLWKHNVRRQAIIFDAYAGSLKAYVNQDWEGTMGPWFQNPWEKFDGWPGSNISIAYHFIHGQKDHIKAREILEELKKHRGKPVYFDGVTWSNDLQTVGRGGIMTAPEGSTPSDWRKKWKEMGVYAFTSEEKAQKLGK